MTNQNVKQPGFHASTPETLPDASDWRCVKQVGLEAATKFASLLTEKNYTNIVLLENNQTSDALIQSTLDMISDNYAMSFHYSTVR